MSGFRKTAGAVLFAAALLAAGMILSSGKAGTPRKNHARAIRVGYFHGGRTALMMRIYEERGFMKKGLNVEFYSRGLNENEYRPVPRSIRNFNRGGPERWGKSGGPNLSMPCSPGRSTWPWWAKTHSCLRFKRGRMSWPSPNSATT